MDNRHLIESAVLNISYPSEEIALSEQSDFEGFVMARLLPIVEAAFDEVSDGDTVIQFETLELDLGEISLSYFYEDLQEKLKEKIRDCLQNEIAFLNVYPQERHKRISRQQSELDLIRSFMLTGRVSWNANNTQQQNVEELFLSVLESNGQALADFISESSNRNEIVARLATQFTPSTLCRLLTFVFDAPDLKSLVGELLILSKRSFGLSQNALEFQIWMEIIQYAFNNKGGRPSLETLLLQVTGTLSRLLPQQQSLVLKQLLRHSRFSKGSDRLFKLLYSAVNNAHTSGLFDDNARSELLIWDELDEDDQAGSITATYRARLIEAMKTGSLRKLKPIWLELLGRHSGLLKKITLSYGQSADVRRVIANKFEEPMIRDIIKVLEPVHYVFIEHIVTRPKVFNSAENNEVVEESVAKRTLWEFSLTYLIAERGSRFNKKSYMASIMWQMAAHNNISIEELIDSIAISLEPASEMNSIGSGLLELLWELKGELVEGLAGSMRERQRTEKNRTNDGLISNDLSVGDKLILANKFYGGGEKQINPDHTAVEALLLALRKGQSDRLNSFWTTLLEEYSEWLEKVFRREGCHAEVIKNITITFSDEMLKDVVNLLEPSVSETIVEAINSLSQVGSTEIKTSSKSNYSRTSVWGFSLHYLLVDRGSVFNKKAYLASVIRQMAAHVNQSVQSVYAEIIAIFKVKSANNALQREMLGILSEIGDYLDCENLSVDSFSDHTLNSTDALKGMTSAKNNKKDSQASNREGAMELEQLELIRAYLLYEKLVGAISMARPGQTSISYHVVRLIHELIEQYPWKFHRFNQEVKSGNVSLKNIIRQLPKSLQRKLLLSFFGSFSGKYPFSLNDFVTRLDLMDKGHFSTGINYAVLFSRLISNHEAGLEALFASGVSGKDLDSQKTSNAEYAVNRPDIQGMAEHDEIDRQSSTPLSMNENTSSLIRAFLLGHLHLKSHDKYSIVSTLELMLSSHPRALLKLLNETLIDKPSSDRLVGILPESLLVKLMLLLRPADHFKAILYADMMTMACVETVTNAGGNADLLHVAKWQFVFDYLLIERRTFSEINFVRMMSQYLLKRSNLQTKGLFNKQLAATITNTSSSATHVSAVRIAMILGSIDSSEKPALQGMEKSVSQESGQDSEAEEFSLGLDARSDQYNDNELIRVENSFYESTEFEEEDEEILENIYINNAGLVLLSPYLPRYFESFSLIENGKFKDRKSAERGVHLLQYLLNGSTENFEQELVLNKLLCGIKTGKPIIRSIEITDNEKAVSNSLLLGVIGNWPALKNTSVEGLQETFLQREAQLQLKNDSWSLLVQSKAFDILLDQLPWGFTTIKHPWMDKPIHVDWR